MKSFAPTIKVDGETVTPKGHEWVLGFALAGCEWAIEEASKPEFLVMVRDSLKQDMIIKLDILIGRHEDKISEIKKQKDDYAQR